MTNTQFGVLLFSLALGLCNFVWNIFSTLQARKLSKTDDFWFRKIVGPFVLERALEFASELTQERSSLIRMRGKRKVTRDRLREFAAAKAALAGNMVCLKLFSDGTYMKVCERLDDIEDRVSREMHSLSDPSATEEDATRAVDRAISAASTEIFGLLGDVQRLHMRGNWAPSKYSMGGV